MTTIENSPLILSTSLAHVSETGLLTLYCHAIESQSADPILADEKAVEIAERLRPVLAASDRESLRRLARKQVSPALVVHISLRARYYDDITRDFLSRHPGGTVVNLGCGMDSRFFRIDDGRVLFFDLDLPEVIDCKRQLLDENERYRMIGASVFDAGWMDVVAAASSQPVLFIAEGLFMYLEPEKVRALVTTLSQRFPGSELVCEVVNRRWIGSNTNWMVRAKLQRGMKIGSQAGFTFGVADSHEMETWAPGITLLGEWSYFESNHPKLGWMHWLGKLAFIRRVQWTAHYRLGA
jgi:methyltransferase (TIGR00027 family)